MEAHGGGGVGMWRFVPTFSLCIHPAPQPANLAHGPPKTYMSALPLTQAGCSYFLPRLPGCCREAAPSRSPLGCLQPRAPQLTTEVPGHPGLAAGVAGHCGRCRCSLVLSFPGLLSPQYHSLFHGESLRSWNSREIPCLCSPSDCEWVGVTVC